MCVMLARALRDNGQGKLRMELTITWRRCVLAAIVLRERLRAVQYVGVGVAMLGVVLISASRSEEHTSELQSH